MERKDVVGEEYNIGRRRRGSGEKHWLLNCSNVYLLDTLRERGTGWSQGIIGKGKLFQNRI